MLWRCSGNTLGCFDNALGVLWAIQTLGTFLQGLPGSLCIFEVFIVSRDTQSNLGFSRTKPLFPDAVPFISHKNLHVQKSWAEEWLDWTVDNWRAVNFSDESIFHVFGSDGMEWCWRRPGECLDPWFTKKKVKHGGGKVTVWGMITAHGVGRIIRIEGNLNKELYCDILQDDVLGTFRDLHLDYHDYYFQQDNDPKHMAKVIQAWFHENNINLLPWPPNSPNISIIENLWDHLDCWIWARNPLPHSEEDLWIALQEEWYKIDVSFIEKLYASLPWRISAVYLANGGNTRY